MARAPAIDRLRSKTIAPGMAAFAPDVVVNAAAHTGVDRAETGPDLAFAVNRDGAGARHRGGAQGPGDPAVNRLRLRRGQGRALERPA